MGNPQIALLARCLNPLVLLSKAVRLVVAWRCRSSATSRSGPQVEHVKYRRLSGNLGFCDVIVEDMLKRRISYRVELGGCEKFTRQGISRGRYRETAKSERRMRAHAAEAPRREAATTLPLTC